MKHVIRREDLEPRGSTSYTFEGYKHGAPSVSLHLTDLLPGEGPRLHRHPNEEVFVIHEGQATYTVGDTQLLVAAGQIVLVPAGGTPHKFVNTGTGPLRQTSIHPSAYMVEEQLES